MTYKDFSEKSIASEAKDTILSAINMLNKQGRTAMAADLQSDMNRAEGNYLEMLMTAEDALRITA